MKFQFVSLVFFEFSDLTLSKALGIFPLLIAIILRMTSPIMKPLSRLLETWDDSCTFRCSST